MDIVSPEVRVPLRLLSSPSPEMELLSLRQVRAESLFLFHLACWAGLSLYLVAINLITTGLGQPWSLWPAVVWLAVLPLHWTWAYVVRRRWFETRHRRLTAKPAIPDQQDTAEPREEFEDLRGKVVHSVAEARDALRTISPEAVSDLSRGETHALTVLSWLEEAERLLPLGTRGRELRPAVTTALSRPGNETTRVPLQRLLGQLDVQDVKLARLERVTGERRSLLDSFLLTLESAGLATASVDLLAPVIDPLRERVQLLAQVVAEEGRGPAPTTVSPDGRIDRLQNEVRLAQELQRSILPEAPPEVPGLAVAHLYRPSSEVGGDFFDYYTVESGGLLVAVGDASGHGLDSSMVSSMAKSALFTHVAAGRSLESTMTEMNRMMYATLGRRRLMSLALVEIEPSQSRLRWVNAGQIFPILRRRSEVRELEQPGYPLGVRPDSRFEIAEEALEPGDLLLLLTDGYVEAVNPAGEPYGWRRLEQQLREIDSTDVELLITELAEDLWSYLDGEPPHDDVTLVAIRVDE
ncbi:MAG: SpoIIE family protein phosphatase [Thermoanaerobaculia bacterium]